MRCVAVFQWLLRGLLHRTVHINTFPHSIHNYGCFERIRHCDNVERSPNASAANQTGDSSYFSGIYFKCSHRSEANFLPEIVCLFLEGSLPGNSRIWRVSEPIRFSNNASSPQQLCYWLSPLCSLSVTRYPSCWTSLKVSFRICSSTQWVC